MKYIKRFESKSFNKGDYVVIKDRKHAPFWSIFDDYAESHVSKIYDINYIGNTNDPTLSLIWTDIKNDSGLPQHILKKGNHTQLISGSDVEFLSRSKKEAEDYLNRKLAIKKFNV